MNLLSSSVLFQLDSGLISSFYILKDTSTEKITIVFQFRPIQRDREKPGESLVTRKLMEALAKKRRDERKRKMDEDETMEVDKPSTSGKP